MGDTHATLMRAEDDGRFIEDDLNQLTEIDNAIRDLIN